MKKLKSIISAAAVAMSFLTGILNPCLTISGAESEESIFSIDIIDNDGDGTDDYISIDQCKDSSLTEIEIPAEIDGLPVKEISTYAFMFCENLTSINVSENNGYYSSIDGVLFNKEQTRLIHYPLNKSDEQYSIPQGVEIIDDYAFYNCKNLKKINIPDSVTEICDSAFYGCSSLIEISLSNSVQSIGNNAFYNCGITSIELPDSVTKIGKNAFYSCQNLTNVKLPNGIKTIEEETFAFSGITSIDIPDSVTTIEEGAFFCCYALKCVKMSVGVTEINDKVFYWCPDNMIFFGSETSFLKEFTEKNGYIFNPPILSGVGEYEYQLNSDGTLILCFKPEETGKYYFQTLCPKYHTMEFNGDYDYYNDYTYDCTAGEDYVIKIEPYNSDYTDDKDKNWSEGDSEAVSINIYKALEIEKDFSQLENFTVEADSYTTIKFTLDKDENVRIDTGGVNYWINSDSDYNQAYDRYDLKKGTYTLYLDPVRKDTVISIKKYVRAPLDYKIDPNKNNKINTVSKNVVNVKNVNYDTYDNNLYYYIWSGTDILQEVCDTAGNAYAVYGTYDSISVVPKNTSKKTITINKKGFTFGAAVIGDDNNLYVMWGKSISDDVIKKSMKVGNVVVTKYNLNGTELSSLALPVETTEAQFPFDAGNANIDYNDGVIGLLFDTEWLVSSDGLHHQGSVYVEIDAAKMKMLDVKTNTLSHSFGVSMIPTDYGFAAVQRGDGYPRGIILTAFSTKEAYGGAVFHSSGQYGTNQQHLDGNATYVHMGGIAQSASTYAIAGKSERIYTTDVYYDSNLQTDNYDVFVKICDKSLRDDFATDCAGLSRVDRKTGEVADRNIVWLTQCSKNEKSGNVKIVTLSDGSYCVLWERFINGTFDSVRYVILDERGYTLRKETPLYGARLSNTSIQPIVQNDTLTWAVADGYKNNITWYSVDINKLSDGIKGDANCDGKLNISDAAFIAKKIAQRKNAELPSWADFNGDGKITIKDASEIAKYMAKRGK